MHLEELKQKLECLRQLKIPFVPTKAEYYHKTLTTTICRPYDQIKMRSFLKLAGFVSLLSADFTHRNYNNQFTIPPNYNVKQSPNNSVIVDIGMFFVQLTSLGNDKSNI